ncbi:MAG: hypothetical protein NWF14_08930 [Candidatus Bathyarchaeota archaeon]|nr:hypothetical protein [Candidatus Bathyarchaeota archaeon]
MDSDVWLGLFIVAGIVAVALFILLLMERERKKPLTGETAVPTKDETWAGLPFTKKRTVSADMFEEARDKLRILDLEREILSYGIRRLYEARAEGKITEEERDRLTRKYKMDLNRIKEEIARGESVVALNELERMQEEFINLFSERFEALNKRIEELRTLSGFAAPQPREPAEPEEMEEKPEEEAVEGEETKEKTESSTQPTEKAAPPKPKRKTNKPKPPPEPEKSEAEKKVEQIVAEVEKVLEKLGQMEVEE